MKRVVVNMSTSRKERFKLYKAKKRWLIAGLVFAGAAMMTGGQVSADQVSDAHTAPVEAAVSTQPDASSATGAVVTATSATLTTDATTDSTKQEAVEPASTPVAATDTTNTTPVAPTTAVSTNQDATADTAVQPQATTQAPAQPVATPATDTTQENAQQATTTADVAHTWDYANDDTVKLTVDATINGAVNANGQTVAEGGDFTQNVSGSSTARVVNGYSVTVSIDNTTGKYRNGDTIQIPIYGEMMSDNKDVASQRFDVVSATGTLMNGNNALGKYAVSNGVLSITLTSDLFGKSTSELTIVGSSASPIANTAIWFNKQGIATLYFGQTHVTGSLTFTVTPKATTSASTSQSLYTKSDSIGVQSFFQDNQYLDALYKGNVATATKDENGAYNADLVQIQHVVINSGTVKAVTSDRTYANFFVPQVDKNGVLSASSVSAAAITLVTKDLQIAFENDGTDIPVMESEVAKSLKKAGIGAYVIIKIDEKNYLIAYNIGNPYKDYSTEKLSGNSNNTFTNFLKSGNNQGNLTDADLSKLQGNIATATNNKMSVGAGSVVHIFDVLFADNGTKNSLSATLDTFDTNGNKLSAVSSITKETTPDSQNFNGQARLTVQYVDNYNHTLLSEKTEFAKPGTAYAESAPDIPGYKLDHNNGDAQGVYSAANTTNSVVFVYVAKNQKAVVNFVDQTDDKILSSEPLTGKTNTKSDYTPAEKIAYYESMGYELVSNDFPANGLVFDADDSKDQVYTVVLKHKTAQVTPHQPEVPGQPVNPGNPDGPKWQPGVAETDLKKTVNETIHYEYAIGGTAAADKTDKVSFSRTATVDLATGKVVAYGEWTSDGNDTTFDAKESPVITGYTASRDIPAVTGLTADHKDVDETVTYTADEQKAIVNFVDQTDGDANLYSVTLKGVSNGKDNYTPANKIAEYESEGYELVSNDFPGTGLVFDTDDTKDQVYTVVLKHKLTPVAPDKPEKPGQPVMPSKPDGPKWPTENDLNKTVNETINYVYEDGAKAAESAEDKVSFSRTAIVDEVTGEVTYGNWVAKDNDATFDAVKSPVIAGYKTNDAQIDAITVNANSTDVVKTVTYTADDQKAVVNFVDQTDGKTLSSKPLTGKTNTKSDYTPAKTIADYESKGYEFVSNDFPENGLVFDTDDNKDQVYTVVLKHKMTPVAPDKPEKPGQPVNPDKPDGPKWPTENDLNKKVTETINYIYEGGAKAAEPAKDEVSFSRTAIVDEVTGNVTYGDWVAKDNDTTFDAVKSPVIVGYEPNPAQIDAITVTANMGDVEKTVTYKAEKQHATVSYVDEVTGETLLVDKIDGDSNAKSDYTTATKIAKYVKAGYKFDSSDFPADGLTFDTDTAKSQDYTVKFTHETTTTDTPETPGSPIDPKNPDGPKWSDGVSETDLKKTVKETVHYVFSDGSVAAPDATDSVEFTRTATVDEVTGKVIAYGEWTATDGDTTFDVKVSPVITGYFADKANIAEVDNLTPASTDLEEKVIYTKLGSYVPELPDGSKPSKPYPNDPTDPSKPGTDVPAMPYVPGYTPEGPDGHPLTPVDPDNPSKGYNPPAIPDDPATDTVIKYDGDNQKVVYNVIDDTTGKKLEDSVAFDSGKTKAALNKSQSDLEAIADGYAKRGYEIVSVDPVPGAFDDDDKTAQVVDIHLKHKMVPVTPENPGMPGSPIDPSNPEGPKWPAGTDKASVDVTVKETVHYVYEDGAKAAEDASDAVKFTRTATVDEVTGEVTYGDWVAKDNDTAFDAKVSPVITGYIADKDSIAEVDNLTPTSTDVEEKVIYTKLGSYVPELPDGSTPSVPYPNDPTNPTKPGTDVPAMPYVPGYTPEGPDGTPLTPVDPDTPSKGYNPPAVPNDPTTDTVIKYDSNEQTIVYNVIDDTTGKKLEDSVAFDSGKTKAALNKSQSDLQAIADGYVKRGYEIVSVDPVPGAFDDDDNTPQVVNIHLKHVTKTVTPENPGMPDSPIDPSNPDGPQWPAGTDKNSVDAVVKETVHYVYEDGTTASADVTDTVELTRTATVDEVTGEVTYSDWTAKNGKSAFDAKVSPVITGYTPTDVQIATIEVTADMGDVSRTVTYKADEQKAVVNFVDQDTGEVLKTQSLQGVTNGHEAYTPAKDIADYERVVYDLVSNDFPIDGFQYDSNDTNVQEFTVVLKHKTAIAVVPNEPQYMTSEAVVPNEPIKVASSMVPNEPIYVSSAVVPNEPIYVSSSVVPNDPIVAPTSAATGDHTVHVQKVTTNEMTKQNAAGDTTVAARANDRANAKGSVATSNTVSLPDTAAKGDQDKNALLVAFAVMASLLTFGFVQKRK